MNKNYIIIKIFIIIEIDNEITPLFLEIVFLNKNS